MLRQRLQSDVTHPLKKQPFASPSKSFFYNFFPFAAHHPTLVSQELPTGPSQAMCPHGASAGPPAHSQWCFADLLGWRCGSYGESWATWARQGVFPCSCSCWISRQQQLLEELGLIHISLGLIFQLGMYRCAAAVSKVKVSSYAQKEIEDGGSSGSKS